MSEARRATVALLGGAPPPLSVQWAAGTAAASSGGGTGFAFSGACGVPAPGDRGRIFVNGAGATADEWDDPVLRHEFGHFVACVYSRDESHGGRHSLSERVVPTLAWSEGFANFWGQFLVQERCIWNTESDAIRIYYIDNTPIPPDGPPSPLNTSPTDDASGAVSEGLVAGVLWALSQLSPPTPWSGAPFDALAPLLWSFQSYLTATRVGDYGASGVDLADFLAGWICAAPCYDAELREIAVGTWSYNYKNRSSFAQCPSPYAVPDGGPRRCAGPYAYVLTEAELQRYRFDGALVNRMPLGAAGSLGLATGRNARSLAVLRADGPAPTRAAVSSFSDGTLALYTIAGGREREVDFDPSSPTVDRLSVGMSPRGVAVTPDGRYAFVAVSASDEVVVVDLDERALCKRIAVPREPGSSGPSVPDSIAFLPRARCRSGSTLRGDTCTAYVSLRGTPAAPGHALALLDVQRATDCDVSGSEVSGYVTVLGGGPMPSPAALALEPGGARLAVLGTVSNTVVILDTATNTPVDLMPSVPSEGPFRTGSTPSAVAWFADASRVVFGNILGRSGTRLAGNGVVRLGTLSTGETTYDVGVNNAVYSLVVSSDGTRVYVGDQGGNITALEVSRFTGFPTYPAAATERTGGCLDTRNRAVACAPAASAGASVRAMIQL
jgi:DNA-binding beta-propeller fold protein YncE